MYALWTKLIKNKTYSKAVVTMRVNVLFSNGQFTEEEYTNLINLIEKVYI